MERVGTTKSHLTQRVLGDRKHYAATAEIAALEGILSTAREVKAGMMSV